MNDLIEMVLENIATVTGRVNALTSSIKWQKDAYNKVCQQAGNAQMDRSRLADLEKMYYSLRLAFIAF